MENNCFHIPKLIVLEIKIARAISVNDLLEVGIKDDFGGKSLTGLSSPKFRA